MGPQQISTRGAKVRNVIERDELYRQVWKTPMTKLCLEYGLSDNGLRKICKALSVPTPSAGHWMKLEAGKAVDRPPTSDRRCATVVCARSARKIIPAGEHAHHRGLGRPYSRRGG